VTTFSTGSAGDPATSRVRTEDAATDARRRAVGVAVLFVLVLAAYLPALGNGFVWDDDAHVTKPALRSLHGLWRIWFDVGATLQYYPLLHSAFWLEHRLWGDDPIGYHAVNILLHATAAALVWRILRRLQIPGALLAAAIFALHPVHVESVAWITELKNTLSAVFYLTSAWAYLEFDETRRRRWYAAALALFVAGILSKTVTATLPGALLLVFWWRRGRLSARRDVLPLVPFLLSGAAGGMITAWWELKINNCVGPDFDFSPVERLLLAGRAVWFHAWKLFWPTDLIFIYPRWRLDSSVWWQYLFPLGVLAWVAALWAIRRRTRGPLAGLLYFIGTLFPVLGFFNLYTFEYSLIANHYQYLASLGLITLTSAGAVRLLDRWRLRVWPWRTVPCVALLAILAGLTWSHCRDYRDEETLWRATIEGNPGAWMARANLAKLLTARGDPGAAAAQLREALRSRPDDPEIYNLLGAACLKGGDADGAIEMYRNAIRLDPRSSLLYFNLGVALGRRGQVQDAISAYREALRINSRALPAWSNLAIALYRVGAYQEAREAVDTLRRLGGNPHPEFLKDLEDALRDDSTPRVPEGTGR
jgi:tetratricopeptide (TPR) repeat protein